MNRRVSLNRRTTIARGTTALRVSLLSFLVIGCAGYHVGPVAKHNFNSIAVPVFHNDTLRPQLEAQISNAVIRRLQEDGSLRLEPPSRADVILTGTVFRYQRNALRMLHSDTQVPREFEIVITVRVEARDRRTGETVLKPTEIEGKTDVFIGEDQQSSEEQALPLVADDIGKRVASLIVESW